MLLIGSNSSFLTVTGVTVFLSVISLGYCNLPRQNDNAVKNFRDYLRINTSQFDPDYDSAIAWIQEQATGLDLKYSITRFSAAKNEFVVLLTWTGMNPALESLFLYNHFDTVSAVKSEWTHDPYGAEMDSDENIYGRGAQDMKSITIQYLEAIRNLKSKGVTPNRTIHLGFFPDEEIGGATGIRLFVKTQEFKNLNIGLVLDEGMPTSEPDKLYVYHSQRQLIWPRFTARGEAGHGSLLLENTAAEKILKVVNKLMTRGEMEKLRIKGNMSLQVGDITTINLNILEGGYQANIIPAEFSATFDIRIPPSGSTYTEIMQYFNETCAEAGANVTYEIIHNTLLPDTDPQVTKLEHDAWWWTGFQKAFNSMNLTIVPSIFPASSDGQYMRIEGIPTLGFSPIPNSKNVMHRKDEFLNVDIFLRGIEIYETLIETLTYAPPGHQDKKPITPGKSSSNVLDYKTTTLWICVPLVSFIFRTNAIF